MKRLKYTCRIDRHYVVYVCVLNNKDNNINKIKAQHIIYKKEQNIYINSTFNFQNKIVYYGNILIYSNQRLKLSVTDGHA